MPIGNVASLSQSVYPASTQYGAAVPVPPGAANGMAVATMIDADVLAGPPNQRTITLGLQLSWDGGQTWEGAGSYQFQSGPANVKLGPGGGGAQSPLLSTSIPSNPMPSHVRPYCSLNGPTRIGIGVSFADPAGAAL
jgi:hypothetical protein